MWLAQSMSKPVSIGPRPARGLHPQRGERGRGCAGEGRGGSWAAGVSNTHVTQLFQLMCYNKAVELPAYKYTAGGVGWWLPSLVSAVARAGPTPASPESLEAWPRLACLSARSLYPL